LAPTRRQPNVGHQLFGDGVWRGQVLAEPRHVPVGPAM
jgi:hypothetical protein